MKQTFVLKGLDCANCAEKINQQFTKIEHVEHVEYSFVTGKYTLTTTAAIPLETVSKIVHTLEPDVIVLADNVDAESDDHHGHEHGAPVSKQTFFVKLGLVIAIYLIIKLVAFTPMIELALYIIAYLIIGWDVIKTALKNIARGEIFDENFLMTIATLGALLLGEYPEAIAVMLFYEIGEYFQDRAVQNSRKSISTLMDIRPDYANLLVNDGVEQVSPEQDKIGDLILVKPGEKIPLDGIVVNGESYLNTQALTGESMPQEVSKDSAVISGAINTTGVLTIEVQKIFAESTASKILQLVENASSKKAPTEKFITKFSRVYTPIVCGLAILLTLVPPFFTGWDTLPLWFERALTFLVISCPCALVISVPLGYFGGIGAASKVGVLIKGGNYLEALANIKTILFDKTGTLTKGEFAITDVEVEDGSTYDAVLQYAKYAEWYSNHPIAEVIKKEEIAIDENLITNYQEVAGHGISLQVNGDAILVGNEKLMQLHKIPYQQSNGIGTLLYVAVNNKHLGTIIIADVLKADAKKTITHLNTQNIETIMLTGDNEKVAHQIASELQLNEVFASLLPQDKVAKTEEVMARKDGIVAFVGDGINDAPVLAQADLGLAMGGVGSDAAIEAADVVLMTDEPSKILTAISIAKKTQRIIWQNIIFALGIKVIVMILGALGIATMWLAIFADVGVSLLAILNSMRTLKIK